MLLHLSSALLPGCSGNNKPPFLGLLAALTFFAGLTKRTNDLKAGLSVFMTRGLISLWAGVSTSSFAAAFLLFLGSISGSGNQDLLTIAGVLAAVPFAPAILVPIIIGLMAGFEEPNKHGNPSQGLTLQRSDARAVIATAFVVIAVGLGINTVGSVSGEPKLIQAIWDLDSAREGSTRKFRALLRDGADPNQVSLSGTTALMLSLGNRAPHVEGGYLSATLLEYGADPNTPSTIEGSTHKHTPLVVALSGYDLFYPMVYSADD